MSIGTQEQQKAREEQAREAAQSEQLVPVNELAVGLSVFAAISMLIIGVLSAIEGLAAILENEFYVLRGEYVFKFDVTTWGWIHLVGGAIVAAAGAFIFSGRAVARGIGIAVAAVSAIMNFMFLPYYPIWSLLIIALDVAVIWALTKYSRGMAKIAWK